MIAIIFAIMNIPKFAKNRVFWPPIGIIDHRGILSQLFSEMGEKQRFRRFWPKFIRCGLLISDNKSCEHFPHKYLFQYCYLLRNDKWPGLHSAEIDPARHIRCDQDTRVNARGNSSSKI